VFIEADRETLRGATWLNDARVASCAITATEGSRLLGHTDDMVSEAAAAGAEATDEQDRRA